MTKPFLGYESHSFPGRRLKTTRTVTWEAGGDIKTGWSIPVFPGFIILCITVHFFIFPLGMRLFLKPSSVHLTAAKTETSHFVKRQWPRCKNSGTWQPTWAQGCSDISWVSGIHPLHLLNIWNIPLSSVPFMIPLLMNSQRLASVLQKKRQKWGKVQPHCKGALPQQKG